MNRLKLKIGKNGFDYIQVKRFECEKSGRSVALYSMHPKNSDHIMGYESFIIPVRRKPITTPSGIVVPPGEKFPGNEEFGTTVKASHFGGSNALGRAQLYFEELKKYLADDKNKRFSKNSTDNRGVSMPAE